MHPQERIRLAVSLLLASAVCVTLASCAWFAPVSYDDYVGPPSAGEKLASIPGVPSPEHPPTLPKLPPTGPVEMSIEEAILVALENNRAFQVQRFNPSIRSTFVDQERAAFDPNLTAGISRGRNRTRQSPGEAASAAAKAGSQTSVEDTTSGDIGLTEFLPTGTTIGLTGGGNKTDVEAAADTHSGTAPLGLSVTQSLLRGFGPAVNLASLRQAQIDAEVSQYELRGSAEALVAQVEETYWDYILAQRQIEIFTQSANLAEQQLKDTQERIAVGKLAPTELASAEAELALRQEDLINARTTLATTRLRLMQRINLPGQEFWNREIVPKDQPPASEEKLDDVESSAALALRFRPEMNQARLQVLRGDLEVVKTKNGLLPKLDAFVNLGRSAFADSFSAAVRDPDGTSHSWSVGLALQYPIGNRGAEARNRRALFNRDQAEVAVDNLAQLVQLDVRTAYLEVTRSKEQIAATAATRKKQEEKHRAETEKFHADRSTALLVNLAQRDLLESQIAELQAVINYRKARVEYYRLEGSLLARRGIRAPGLEPVEFEARRK